MSPGLRPLLIVALVLTEVGLWQWRVLLTARGHRGLPTLLGVGGAVLQVTAIAQVVTNLRDPVTVAAYAVGVGGGVLLGVVVSARFTAGAVRLSLVTSRPGVDEALRRRGWPVITYQGRGASGPVDVLEIVVPDRRRRFLLSDLDDLDPGAARTLGGVDAPPPARAPSAGRRRTTPVGVPG